ncbi:MAG: PQQ-binding-like beta-propeller repeat protein, partial [Acidobacteriota bacterium]|nr:PQQ-binding-like beta-propeller repeat protein [Acidobacteriota bacterium]
MAQEPSWQRLINSDKEPQNWLSYGGNYAAHRFSALDQVTRENVKTLAPVWMFQTGEVRGGLNATPIVMDGVMYLMGPMNRVFAINAVTGEVIWKYFYKLSTKNIPYTVGSRGLAIGYGKVYFGTLDNHFVGLDMKTGREMWDVEIEDMRQCGCNVTSPPLIVKDKVIVGVTGGEHAHRGYLNAYDAKTGKHLWRFYTIPGPGEPGSETWGPQMLKFGGAPTWLTGSYDADLNLLYWGVGNPSSDYYGELRPGDNLYTNSIVALDPDTGKLKWYFQNAPGETLDLDEVFERVLIDHGQQKTVMTVGKSGLMWKLDRITGKFLDVKETVFQNVWASIDMKTGRTTYRDDILEKKPGEAVASCPSPSGGHNWQATTYDPSNDLLIIPLSQNCA